MIMFARVEGQEPIFVSGIKPGRVEWVKEGVGWGM